MAWLVGRGVRITVDEDSHVVPLAGDLPFRKGYDTGSPHELVPVFDIPQTTAGGYGQV